MGGGGGVGVGIGWWLRVVLVFPQSIFPVVRYKFRPAPDNPYLHVPQAYSDDEIEMDEV